MARSVDNNMVNGETGDTIIGNAAEIEEIVLSESEAIHLRLTILEHENAQLRLEAAQRSLQRAQEVHQKYTKDILCSHGIDGDIPSTWQVDTVNRLLKRINTMNAS